MEMILSQFILTSILTTDILTILHLICLHSDALPNDYTDMSVQISPFPHSSYETHRFNAQNFLFLVQAQFSNVSPDTDYLH
jgi:hypothetical protein